MNVDFEIKGKDLIFIELRLDINRRLYEEGVISIEIYQKMENYLVNKRNSNKKGND